MLKLLAFLALSLLLLLAACGGDDDGTSGVDDDGGATTTQISNGDGDDDAQPSETENLDGDDDDDRGAPSDFHACDLFTGAEMSDLVGTQMNDGRDYLATADGATNCLWEGDIQVFVEVLLEGGQDWYDAVHFPGANDPGDTEDVEGIGDVAIWDSFLGTLDTVDDDRFVAVQAITSFTDYDDKEVATEVAQAALARLP